MVAGTAGLLNQYMVANGYQSTPGQGSLNSRLYSLAATAPGAFHDVTMGNNITAACPQSTCAKVGFTAGPGYDQATGLGTLDVFNLVTAWPLTGTVAQQDVSIELTPSLSSLSSQDTVTLTATLTSSNGIAPSGSVSFYASGTFLRSAPLTGSGSAASALITLSASELGAGDNGSVDVSAFYGSARASITLSVATAMVLNGISSAASYQTQYAPGMIISLFGANFGALTTEQQPAPLPSPARRDHGHNQRYSLAALLCLAWPDQRTGPLGDSEELDRDHQGDFEWKERHGPIPGQQERTRDFRRCE